MQTMDPRISVNELNQLISPFIKKGVNFEKAPIKVIFYSDICYHNKSAFVLMMAGETINETKEDRVYWGVYRFVGFNELIDLLTVIVYFCLHDYTKHVHCLKLRQSFYNHIVWLLNRCHHYGYDF